MKEEGFFAGILRGEQPQSPISKLLGWKFVEFDSRQSVIKVEMIARPEFVNPAGLIHGGMLSAMLDETLSPALAATLGPGEFAPTIEMKVCFIGSAKIGTVIGIGRVVSKGRSICFLEGQLLDEHGSLLATATATSKIMRSERAVASLTP